jgi:hypothetical protein
MMMAYRLYETLDGTSLEGGRMKGAGVNSDADPTL